MVEGAVRLGMWVLPNRKPVVRWPMGIDTGMVILLAAVNTWQPLPCNQFKQVPEFVGTTRVELIDPGNASQQMRAKVCYLCGIL